MTALSEALSQAQRAALVALGKIAVAEGVDDAAMRDNLAHIGCTDSVEQDYLLACWVVLHRLGSQAPVPEPQSYSVRRLEDPATDAQQKLIAKLCDEQKVPAPNGGLTKATAHEVIDSLKAGSYDPDKWTVPF